MTNVLELRAQKGLAGVERLLDVGGQRFGWPVARKPRGSSFPSGSYVACVIMYADSASVAGVWGELEDEKSRSDDSGRRRMWEFTPFVHSDLQSDVCDEEEGSTSEITVFLAAVYDLARRDEGDSAIDVIFQYMNSLLVEGRFEDCDRILGEVEIARIPTVLMVSFLTITAAAKTNLKNRGGFFKDVRRVVARERGEKTAQRLLDGLD